jgi:TrmH family RNA methyltransferase
VEEVFNSGWETLLALHAPDPGERLQAILDGFARGGVRIEQVSPGVFKAASDAETPQGLLAVVRMRELSQPAHPDFLLILDEMRDPGNLGAILRTALASACQAVLLSPGCVDPYSPKVLRSGMGAHFHLPIRELSWDGIQAILRGGHPTPLKAYLSDVEGGLPYTQADFFTPLALITGSEARGAGQAAQALADEKVHIPMPGDGESLNAAIATSILLFEACVHVRSNQRMIK